MVINGSCSTNMCARQLSFNSSSMVWGAYGPVASPLDPPLATNRGGVGSNIGDFRPVSRYVQETVQDRDTVAI